MLHPIKTLATSPLAQACATALLLAAVRRAMPSLLAGNLRGALKDAAGLADPLREVLARGLHQHRCPASPSGGMRPSDDDLTWHHWLS